MLFFWAATAGKTKVLMTRVAYLLQHYQLRPEDLVCVSLLHRGAARKQLTSLRLQRRNLYQQERQRDEGQIERHCR
jgi:superfamily I DNA/RNA helicase